jgi:hypothetical protein
MDGWEARLCLIDARTSRKARTGIELAGRCKHLAISRIDESEASPREISSRSRSVSARSARRRIAGTIPP